ncbi:magnesium/cobalt transporter CorA [Bradymonas sediminis]|uniref:Magnesium transport protein CorA n=1 Tax=Bradymonas sediminis TaxID=1548548 RepID=A0A2Z4FKU5_9DELT|nr:magnesium/cobalt transporter CorA [Bradymonas sediminis]AWV89376.1 magnesium and cobalt transport protein CorA [Bradymonas sediminis]TDP73557.1 magnesium transporter [Bradymonas sediminis]
MVEKPAKYLRRKLGALRSKRGDPAQPGNSPGELHHTPEAPPPTLKLIAYNLTEHVEQELDDVEQVLEYLGKFSVVWLDVRGVEDANLLKRIGEIFSFGALSLEDVQEIQHRAKVDFFENCVQLQLKMPRWTDQLSADQISLFVGRGFVVTFQTDDAAADYFEPIRSRVRRGRPLMRSHGADYLGYAIIDRVVDAGFPVVEEFEKIYYEIEVEVIEPSNSNLLMRIHAMNCQLWEMKRLIAPHRDILEALRRRPESLFTEAVQPYLKDCLDHAIQISESVESYHSLGNQLIDFSLSLASQRQNEITKVLTIIATIFIPLTFIAGVYGMNFNPSSSPWNMPELDWPYAYPATLLAMALIAVGLVVYFWRKGWIGTNS